MSLNAVIEFTSVSDGHSVIILDAIMRLQSVNKHMLLRLKQKIAVACALDPRLGQESPLAGLGPELLAKVCKFL